MLGLRLATDERWVRLAETNLHALLSDHAWCEQKAALHAMATVTRYPHLTDLVAELTRIAQEELEHFGMVQERLRERGWALLPEEKDDYVGDLARFIRRGGNVHQQLVDRLLFAAMIEARSCERFRMLSERVEDAGLRAFYRDLMVSEAHHYTTFLGFARAHAPAGEDVEARWQAFLDHEAGLMAGYGKRETMHG